MADFMNFAPGAFAFRQTVYNGELEEDEELGIEVDNAGEALQGALVETGEDIYIFNATACYNCLDHARCVPAPEPDWTIGQRGYEPAQYAFRFERIGGSSLFKIPESIETDLFTVLRDGGCFYTKYHALGLKGLVFQEVWSGDTADK